MIDPASMPRFPKTIPENEIYDILTASKGDKVAVSFRLSDEGRRILEEEAERYGVDKTKALELLLREVRELRKARKPSK